ncbi:hypothetical protein CLV51_1011369 [Chitinophaga niastensis]|uniref:Uncharacterized protein n=1 Tax=Chitinophaga niastensis TaxID=536980 RepID=A0A2P8HUX0_CHINA|nr:hypothetical protein [Chitinophaga niastensis]PSL50026.1 hypothetical protein CLV51_1011369 [Chitinophaga niastensis]
MISAKSTVAALLCLSLFSIACKKDKGAQVKSDYLDITTGGFSVMKSNPGVYRITASAAYKVQDNGHLTQLSDALSDSLIPYFKIFPLQQLIAEGGKSFSLGGAADMPFWTFTSKGSANDTARVFYIDFGGGPVYMKGYLEKINQTFINCKL